MVTRTKIRKVVEEYKAHLGNSDRASDDPLAHLRGLDWVSFASKTFIRSGDKVLPFIPFTYQTTLIDSIEESSTLVLKSRQLGISEAIINYGLWKAVNNPAWLGVYVSRTGEDSRQLGRRCREQMESLGITRDSDNLLDLSIAGGGRLLYRAPTADCARGLAGVSAIFFDEACFISDLETIFSASLPSTTSVGDRARICLISTPGQPTGLFYQLINQDNQIELLAEQVRSGDLPPTYKDAVGSRNRIIIYWKSHPEYSKDPNFLSNIQEKFGLSDAALAAEYDLSFGSVSTAVFAPNLVREATVAKDEIPDSSQLKDFYIGIDPAFSSSGADYCVALVLAFDRTNSLFWLVDWYRKRNRTNQENIYYISQLISNYKPTRVAIEVNSGGSLYHEHLTSEFPNIRIEEISTTSSNKASMINRSVFALEQGALRIPGQHPVVDELLAFQRQEVGNTVTLEAGGNSHDDCVLALSFALYAARSKTRKIGGFPK